MSEEVKKEEIQKEEPAKETKDAVRNEEAKTAEKDNEKVKEEVKTEEEIEVDFDSVKFKLKKEDAKRLIEIRKELKQLRRENQELKSQFRINKIQQLLLKNNLDERLLEEATIFLDKKADQDLKVDGEPLEKYVEKYVSSKNLQKKSSILGQLANKTNMQSAAKKLPQDQIRVGLQKLFEAKKK